MKAGSFTALNCDARTIRFDCLNRAFRLANTTIDAFVGVNDEHVLALIEAVHRTHLDTVH